MAAGSELIASVSAGVVWCAYPRSEVFNGQSVIGAMAALASETTDDRTGMPFVESSGLDRHPTVCRTMHTKQMKTRTMGIQSQRGNLGGVCSFSSTLGIFFGE